MTRVAIDVGGTFTDCLVLDHKGRLQQFKAPTTPEDPSEGLMDALEKAAKSEGKTLSAFIGKLESIIHGTTLATNAPSALIARMRTTEGFWTSWNPAGFKTSALIICRCNPRPRHPRLPVASERSYREIRHRCCRR
jgi:hypothetical protein